MIRLFLDIIRHQDGGKGSGNFGHKGRPGKRGGSSKNGGSGSEETSNQSENIPIKTYSISNSSNIYDSNGKADMVFTSIDYNQISPFKEQEKDLRFRNLLSLHKSEFLNFLQSDSEDNERYKESTKEILDKILKGKDVDFDFYLNYPSLIDEDNKKKLFAIGYEQISNQNALIPSKQINIDIVDTESSSLNNVKTITKQVKIDNTLEGKLLDNLCPGLADSEKFNLCVYMTDITSFRKELERNCPPIPKLFTKKHLNDVYKNWDLNSEVGLDGFKYKILKNTLQGFSLISNDSLIDLSVALTMQGVDKFDTFNEFYNTVMEGMKQNEGKPFKELLKPVEGIEKSYELRDGFELHELSPLQRCMLGVYKERISRDADMTIDVLLDRGMSFNDLFGKLTDKEKQLLLRVSGYECKELMVPMRVKLVGTFLDGIRIDAYDTEQVKQAIDAIEKGDMNALLEISRKKDWQVYSNIYPNIVTNETSKLRELSNEEAQIFGAACKFFGMDINGMQAAGSKSLHDFTLQPLDISKINKDAFSEHAEQIINGIKDIGISKVEFNLSKNLQSNTTSRFYEAVEMACMFECCRGLDIKKDSDTKQLVKQAMDRFNKGVLSEKELEQYKYVYTSDTTQKMKSVEAKGSLVKADTKELDTFIDGILNNVYDEGSVKYQKIIPDYIKPHDTVLGDVDLANYVSEDRLETFLSNLNNINKKLEDTSKNYEYVKDIFVKKENWQGIKNKDDLVKKCIDLIEQSSDSNYHLAAAGAFILKNINSINDSDARKMPRGRGFFVLGKVLPKSSIKPYTFSKNDNQKQKMLKANRIASRYQAIKNKPDIKANFLDTTVIKDADLNESWNAENSCDLLQKLMPSLVVGSGFYKPLAKGANASSIKGISHIGDEVSEEFEQKHDTYSDVASKRFNSTVSGSAEPIKESISNNTSPNLTYNEQELRSLIDLVTSSGYHYTSALQEDNQGMGSFIRTVVAASPVYEGEFLRCERASDLYRNYENIRVGDNIVFNAQHFTYDPTNFGQDAADMFGEIGFRVKGKMPFLNMMPFVNKHKMTEWEGLVAGCFKVKKITKNTKAYNANFEKLIDLEFDWEKWKSYLHMNSKMFANQIGLYDRNMNMKAQDFLNSLLKMWVANENKRHYI